MEPTRRDRVHKQSAAVLRALKSYRGLSDGDIAQLTGLSRSGVQGYVAGDRQMTVSLMQLFADALNVKPLVFFMEPDEALGWVLTNTPNASLIGHRQEGRSYPLQLELV